MEAYKNIVKRFQDGVVLQLTCRDLRDIIKEERKEAYDTGYSVGMSEQYENLKDKQ